MFSLNLSTEPVWLDLSEGVRIKVRRLNSAILAAARAYSTRILGELFRELADRLKLGAPTDDLPDLENADTRTGLFRCLLAVGLAQQGIIEWQGIGDAHGAPLELTPATAEQFARLPIGLAFLDAYEATLEPVHAEGNASAAGPHGFSDPAATTAPAAPNGAPNAPAT